MSQPSSRQGHASFFGLNLRRLKGDELLCDRPCCLCGIFFCSLQPPLNVPDHKMLRHQLTWLWGPLNDRQLLIIATPQFVHLFLDFFFARLHVQQLLLQCLRFLLKLLQRQKNYLSTSLQLERNLDLTFNVRSPFVLIQLFKSRQLEKMAISAALPLEVAHPASYSWFHMHTHDALSYQISVQRDNQWLSYCDLTIFQSKCWILDLIRSRL